VKMQRDDAAARFWGADAGCVMTAVEVDGVDAQALVHPPHTDAWGWRARRIGVPMSSIIDGWHLGFVNCGGATSAPVTPRPSSMSIVRLRSNYSGTSHFH
jgi:hypothetical protein